jgi:hypothetical protein
MRIEARPATVMKDIGSGPDIEQLVAGIPVPTVGCRFCEDPPHLLL